MAFAWTGVGYGSLCRKSKKLAYQHEEMIKRMTDVPFDLYDNTDALLVLDSR